MPYLDLASVLSGLFAARWRRLLACVMQLLPVLLYTAYFWHLDSDMPDVARWNDYARFTDEGWYSAAALHWVLGGHWYQPHSFNAVAALPAWPALLSVVFSIAGPSMIAARSTALILFGVALLSMYLMLKPYCGNVIAAGATLLVLINPYTYNFVRMAMLEPAVACLTMLGVVLAMRADRWRTHSQLALAGLVLGLLMCLSVLVKTTALVLWPATLAAAWLQIDSSTTSKKSAFLILGAALLAGTLLWTGWFLVLIRPHHLADFHHFFVINGKPSHTVVGLLLAEAKSFYDLFWLGRLFFPLVLISFALSLSTLRTLWRQPLFVAFSLQILTYAAFLGWHGNRQQRYEVLCLIPSAGILAMVVAALRQRTSLRLIYAGLLATSLTTAAWFAVQTVPDMLHPNFTWRNSAFAVSRYMRADATHPQILLAGPGDDITLFTGVSSANPRWPPEGLRSLLEFTQPGWYLAPVPTEDDTVAELKQFYRLDKVDSFVTMPTFSHRELVLFRLEPINVKVRSVTKQ